MYIGCGAAAAAATAAAAAVVGGVDFAAVVGHCK